MLTELDLEMVDVHLPALSAISSQLNRLDLCKCRLRTSAVANTAVFGTGWDSLTWLNLESSSIDAPLAGVSMPQLQQLRIGNFRVDRGPPDIVRIDPFREGCPSCWSAQFEPQCSRGRGIHSNCTGLTSLRDVCLVWDAQGLFEDGPWPAQPLPHIELPLSVTCLKCVSRQELYLKLGVHYVNPVHRQLDLHAMLGMAARCIGAGAPLETLTVERCTTYVAKVDDNYKEPTGEQHGLFYKPVCAALHGLKELDLVGDDAEWARGCSVETVNTVVSCAPDLRDLTFSLLDRRHSYEDVVHIQCRGLGKLGVTFDMNLMLHWEDYKGTLLALELHDARCLQEFTLLVRGALAVLEGDVVHVKFGTPVMAVVAAEARCDKDLHYLHVRVSGLDVRAAEVLQQAPLRQVAVSFEWEVWQKAGENVKFGWKIAVQ